MRMAKMSLKKSFNCKANKGVLREKSNSLNVKKTIAKLDLHNEEIVQRLVAHSVKLQSRMRDRHGNRSNLLQDEEHTLLSKLNRDVKRMCATTGFKTSQKIKLELPLNYYPGPGAYEIIDISQTTKNKSKKCIESERGFVSKER